MQGSLGIFIQERKTQSALRLLREMNLKLDGVRFQRVADVIGIPLIRSPSSQERSILERELGLFQMKEASFQPIHARPRNLLDALSSTVPTHLFPELPRSLDLVGDIAIIELSHKLELYSLQIANAVLQLNPQVRLVLKKTSQVKGVFRTREFQVLAGFGATETVHREFGCDYRLDPSLVYFNPRLAHERRRVAEQVRESEVVVDMFAGVGPYSILAAKLRNSRVYAIDVNPTAIRYLKENILLNKVADRVTPILGDARAFSLSTLRGSADHVIMNLPADAERYLDVAAHILKSTGAYVHFYQFAQRGTRLEAAKERFEQSMQSHNRSVKTFCYCDVVREISPNRVQVAIDAFVE